MPSTTVDPSGNPIPTSSVLIAASKHIAVKCRAENMAFIKCKKKDPNPEKCLDKGREVTHCVLSLLGFISDLNFSFFPMSGLIDSKESNTMIGENQSKGELQGFNASHRFEGRSYGGNKECNQKRQAHHMKIGGFNPEEISKIRNFLNSLEKSSGSSSIALTGLNHFIRHAPRRWMLMQGACTTILTSSNFVAKSRKLLRWHAHCLSKLFQ